MFDKLLEARQKAEEIKKRLDNIIVTGEAEGGLIKITATANKEVTEVSIDQVFLSNANKEELEELLAVAMNHAMRQADNISQTEMQAATKDMLGGLGGLFGQS
ncbi:YbaB/EbfC family nucleoid-associated protein [Parapedobacter sp. ISTM3]|uniref:YbaB/EbfC family nucleoid-associated protein n=1 Tax=Parapedobacter sp. ISTM3 TaxID=2800130 RepID=UPI00190857BE|nr:YbaB/EbfC family nucleoid-associated protein [Parapedobacter sp. ISTM3]MBK1439433.1 YbaB/EbfC family nucleoid-associated protein [Parapedobacter sp. ISTM3]